MFFDKKEKKSVCVCVLLLCVFTYMKIKKLFTQEDNYSIQSHSRLDFDP